MHRLRYGIILFMAITALAGLSCGLSVKESHEIKTNGFITDNCYQAILEIEPEEGSKGLVARRESAYLKAKNVNVKDLAVQNLVNYCVDSQTKTSVKDKNKNSAYPSEYKSGLAKKLKGFVIGGNISFVYYNEKGSMIIGYRIFRLGFRKKLGEVIATPSDEKQEAAITTPGAKS
ncbi:MAG: hypothetical protein KA369_19755 [Spirochaetes bacterium]|nr:hypothetical protein [Spirochaetota bacterium]